MSRPVEILFALAICSIHANVIIDNGYPPNSQINNETPENEVDNSPGGATDYDDQMCRRCICKLNGCPDVVSERCLSADGLCCCCLPGNHPCLDMKTFADEVTDGNSDDTLEDLEQGLENIGQLEKK